MEKLEAAKVYISNRTKEKAKNLESHYKISLDLETLDWGQSPAFDIIINETIKLFFNILLFFAA